MLLFALDDEPLLAETLERAILEAEPRADVRTFHRATQALCAMEKENLRPDAVFLDIEMPGMTGLELAKRIKDISPMTNIIFVTGYERYAVQAMTLYPSGYILKPVTTERIRMELDNLRHPVQLPKKHRMRCQCFGNFDVFIDDKPLTFGRKKTKEILAYLVDRQGASCTRGELISILWGDEPVTDLVRGNLRSHLYTLRTTLAKVGLEDILVMNKWDIAIRADEIDCDYYDYLRCIPEAVNLYHGEYMSQYSWAEMTTVQLDHLLERR